MADRCPACGAAHVPEAPWCTLCYADLRPAPTPPRGFPEATAPGGATATDGDRTYLAAVTSRRADDAGAEPAWPCPSCGAANPLDLSTCAGCDTPFLAQLHDEAAVVHVPGVGDVSTRDRRGRIGLALGGAVVTMVVLLLAATVLGLLA